MVEKNLDIQNASQSYVTVYMEPSQQFCNVRRCDRKSILLESATRNCATNRMVIMNSKSSEPLCKAVITLSHKGRTLIERGIFKPEPNILRIFPIIPSSTSPNLPIILILFSYHYLLFPYYTFALMFQVHILTSRETKTSVLL